MKHFLKQHVVVGLVLALWAGPTWADESQARLNRLYQAGNQAYQDKDYVSCVKYFTQFQIRGEAYLKQHPKIADGVAERLSSCESQIQAALQYYSRAQAGGGLSPGGSGGMTGIGARARPPKTELKGEGKCGGATSGAGF